MVQSWVMLWIRGQPNAEYLEVRAASHGHDPVTVPHVLHAYSTGELRVKFPQHNINPVTEIPKPPHPLTHPMAGVHIPHDNKGTDEPGNTAATDPCVPCCQSSPPGFLPHAPPSPPFPSTVVGVAHALVPPMHRAHCRHADGPSPVRGRGAGGGDPARSGSSDFSGASLLPLWAAFRGVGRDLPSEIGRTRSQAQSQSQAQAQAPFSPKTSGKMGETPQYIHPLCPITN